MKGDMTDQQINEAVALELGWTDIQLCTCKSEIRGRTPDGKHFKHLPNYANDLNACSEMRKNLHGISQMILFTSALIEVVGAYNVGDPWFGSDDIFRVAQATPRDHCEAFLRTIGKWKESTDKQADDRTQEGPNNQSTQETGIHKGV